MEALAALGLASNIIQLIECGFKVIMIAKELHESGQEATHTNKNSGFLAQEMRELSLKLMKQLPSSDLTDDQKALSRLADQCSQLSNKLLVLLDDLKIKKPGRKLYIVTGALRNMRKKRERDQLEADLNNYRRQLNMQINKMSQSDLAQKLEENLTTSSMTRQDILHLKDQVQKLQQNPMVDSVNMADFFKRLEKAIETPLQHFSLLQDLRDPRMLDRFENVDVAHRKTFEWLMHDLIEDSQNDTGTEAHTRSDIEAKSRKHREFVSWLQDDIIEPSASSAVLNQLHSAHNQSIFHIVGKPGAGKSTLMKFICQNEVTLEKLKSWSGEKQLIYAKAFFWKLGDDEQKNLAGLAKCLLYQIFTAAPALMSMVTLPRAQTYLTILRRLLTDSQAFEENKIMLFIDGLDEYDGRPLELVREIVSWTTGSHNHLKICVASRQWNEFEVGFEGCPNLRVHEWTHHDIKNFVMDRFDEIGNLSILVDTADLKTLAEVIVARAEGVFLWVRVVLAAIEQGVLNGDDFKDLQGKVYASPTELKDLYQYLLDSIPECDRQKAFETLVLVYHQHSLLRYTFLGNLSKDPDFAIKMSMIPLPKADLRRHLANTRRQINGRSKCFLDIRVPRNDADEYFQGEELVSFMHITVARFLAQRNIKETIKPYIDHIDFFDRTCQTLIALAKSVDTNQLYSKKSRRKDPTFVSFLKTVIEGFTRGTDGCLSIFYTPRSMSRFLDFLNHIESIAMQRLERHTLETDGKIQLENDIILSRQLGSSIGVSSMLPVSPSQIVRVLVAKALAFECFEQDGYCDLRALRHADPPLMDLIVSAVFSGVMEILYIPRSFRMLEVLFQAGISPNVQVSMPSPGGVTSKFGLWDRIVRRLVLRGVSAGRFYGRRSYRRYEEGFEYQLIELGLRHGATAVFNLEFARCYEILGDDRLIIEVRICGTDGKMIREFSRPLYVDYRSDIVQYARTRNGVLTIRDILAYCFPHDYDHLHKLLDRNSGGTYPPATSSTTPCTSLPTMLLLFPYESRYIDCGKTATSLGINGINPKECKPCLAHTDECFRYFEERHQHRDTGRLDRGASMYFENACAFENIGEAPPHCKPGY